MTAASIKLGTTIPGSQWLKPLHCGRPPAPSPLELPRPHFPRRDPDILPTRWDVPPSYLLLSVRILGADMQMDAERFLRLLCACSAAPGELRDVSWASPVSRSRWDSALACHWPLCPSKVPFVHCKTTILNSHIAYGLPQIL
ncbi:hypothetical protein CSHISOI_09472 [Colletotrichum shisoi]|uniref:Uncharacterized protein n=1 Tax=Colletotrichum shisoi TaxID=2078593 RepID=A0A5Q4BGD6_9PEZI|nr:hypothetical protein CSHISOI_09472 [Colletotrichum shisoi]